MRNAILENHLSNNENDKHDLYNILCVSLQKDDRVCAQLFCFDAGSGYCVAYRPAAEGSPCGDGQVNL
jgi:hypothetical protein